MVLPPPAAGAVAAVLALPAPPLPTHLTLASLPRLPSLLQALLALYPLLWFRLYSFLFRQRAKKLGPGAEAGSSAKKQA